MKKMLRMFSLLVAVVMLLGIPTVTFADDAIAFSAKVSIKVENEDKLELGGTAKLKARVKVANMAYSVSWQK